MARHRDVWLGRGQGIQLFAVTALLLFWSAAAAGWFLLSTRETCPPRRPEMRKLAAGGAALLLLAVYPENLRSSVFGAILTALCGAVLLFVAIWSVGTGLLPTSDVSDSDLVDDVTALLSPWLFGRAASDGTRRTKPFHVPAWLSRRRSGWVLPTLIGLVCGAALVAQELAQPGPSPQGSRRILVIGVYLFLESAGVLTGYWLLAEPLSLIRHE